MLWATCSCCLTLEFHSLSNCFLQNTIISLSPGEKSATWKFLRKNLTKRWYWLAFLFVSSLQIHIVLSTYCLILLVFIMQLVIILKQHALLSLICLRLLKVNAVSDFGEWWWITHPGHVISRWVVYVFMVLERKPLSERVLMELYPWWGLHWGMEDVLCPCEYFNCISGVICCKYIWKLYQLCWLWFIRWKNY